RALRVLRESAMIAAEDTRVTIPMLKRFDIDTRVVSYHDEPPQGRVQEILDTLQPADVAEGSDARVPGRRAAGSSGGQAAGERGIAIVPIPGPSAVIAAAAASGAVEQGFVFGGFLPRQAGERGRKLRDLAGPGLPIILFEAPGRVQRLLEDVDQVFPDARIT